MKITSLQKRVEVGSPADGSMSTDGLMGIRYVVEYKNHRDTERLIEKDIENPHISLDNIEDPWTLPDTYNVKRVETGKKGHIFIRIFNIYI